MEAAPVNGLVHPFKTQNGSHERRLLTRVPPLRQVSPLSCLTYKARVRLASGQSLCYVEMNLG